METTRLALKSCPRCRQGDVYSDLEGETYCLQCGFRTVWSERRTSLVGSSCPPGTFARGPALAVLVSHRTQCEATVIRITAGRRGTWFGTLAPKSRTQYHVKVVYLPQRVYRRAHGRVVEEAVLSDVRGVGFAFPVRQITPARSGRIWWREFSAAFEAQKGLRLVGAWDWFLDALDRRQPLVEKERA